MRWASLRARQMFVQIHIEILKSVIGLVQKLFDIECGWDCANFDEWTYPLQIWLYSLVNLGEDISYKE
jgi:hypothetical protein